MTEGLKNTTNKFSFSISNILSDNFGRTIPKKKCTKKEMFFRPFEIIEAKDPIYQQISSNNDKEFCSHLSENENSNNSNNSNQRYENSKEKIILKNFQLAELLQLTSKHLYEKNDINEKRSEPIYSFSSYSRNIDDITEFNKSQNILSSITQSYAPPLGSLSKAVSQIGQKNFSNLVISSNFSSFQDTSIDAVSSKHTSEMTRNSEFNLKTQNLSQLDNNIDSDDCKSETSSNKEDNQKMWPAWIYCTRYSDRPSSGKNLLF